MLLRILALACRLLPLALANVEFDSGLEDADGLFPVTGDELVQEGGTVTLRCTVQENDNSSLQWSNPAQQTLFFDDKKALRDNRIALVFYSRHELAISISNMTLRDEGDYTCSIFTMPVRTAVAKVVVLAAPKKPEISGYIGPIAEGRTITLMCNTSGSKPLPTIRWFKGSEEMEGQTYESDPTDQRAYALSNVVNLTVWREDNGAVIKCAVNHRALQHNVYTARQRIEVHYSPIVEIRASKEVPEEGEEFMLRCHGRGNPEPSYFNWLRYNGELSERVVVRHENLSFTYLNKTDAGVYQCVAKNIIGTGARNYSLRVHGDPLDLAPATPPAPVNVSLTPSRHDSTTSLDTDPLSQLTQSSIDHAVIGGIVAVIVFIALCLFIVLVRYLIRHKGTYLTHEAKGLDDAPDADTAIINAEVGHSSSEEKKEYFI